MKNNRYGSIISLCMVLATAMMLTVAGPAYAVKVKLSNGTIFNGNVASQNDNYVVMEIGGAKVSIAKTMIVGVEGLPPGVTIPYPGSTASVPATQQPKVVAPSETTQQAAASPGAVSAPPQSKPVEITLKNGAKFKGAIVSETDNLITLQNETGSKVNVYKNIIAEITGRQIYAPAPTVEGPKTTPPPVAAPVAVEPQQPKPATNEAQPQTPKPETPSVVAPALAQETKPVEQPPLPPPVPVAPQPVPAQTPQTNSPAHDAAKPAPTVLQSPSAPAEVAAPVKRSDGRHELLLKNGTVFIGTVVSENDRFLSFSTREGTTINILKRLVRKLDGVPYVIKTAATSPMDTSSQLKKTALTRAAGNAADQPAKTEEPKPASIKRRAMPVLAIKPGVSMAELIDSLKSTYRDQRAVSARQIGTMGQWATGSTSSLVAALNDTAGTQDFPPAETDSLSMEKLLPPGFEAARALSRIGPEAIDELKRGTRNGNPLVRERAVFGCGEAQDAALLPTLQQALKDDDPKVRAMAARGLRFSDAAGALIQALGDPDGDVRTFAASTLGDLRNPGAVKPLMSALKDVKPSVRAQAALALGKAGAKEAVAPMAQMVTDMTPEVREKGAIALGMVKDSTTVTPLLIAITDADPRVRKAAAEALGELRDPRAIPSLYSAMQEKNDSVRTAVEQAIRQLTEIPLLIAALDNENKLVRENTAYILWLMTGTDLGLDKKAWTDWFAEQGKATGKKAEGENKENKDKEKKEEKKKK